MNLKTKNNFSCYACTKKAISREHVPAQCFFPKGFKNNLLTVPSCKKHNQDNSKNVEYIRDIITTCFQVNNIGFAQFENKTFKSVTRNSKLIHKLFDNSSPALIKGKETRALEIDLNIFDTVFNLVGKALYYYDFKKRFTHKFKIYPTSFSFNHEASNEDKKRFFEVVNALNGLKYNEMKINNPKVFKYYIFTDNNSIVYKNIFYEGFIVFLTYVR